MFFEHKFFDYTILQYQTLSETFEKILNRGVIFWAYHDLFCCWKINKNCSLC